ncbi:MAG TPA: hypothetical protein VF042_01060 [Gemmatimonadaceae bacterium]
MSIRRLLLSVILFVTIVSFSQTASAQAAPAPSRAWILTDALGYGALGLVTGAAVGIIATSSRDCGFGPCIEAAFTALGGTLLGAGFGANLGISARRAAANGRPISGAHRGAMIAGGILGGATTGALISSTMINGEGTGTPIGSDELTFFSLTGGGAVLGMVFVVTQRHQLDRITVSPTVGPKRYGLNAQLSF